MFLVISIFFFLKDQNETGHVKVNDFSILGTSQFILFYEMKKSKKMNVKNRDTF